MNYEKVTKTSDDSVNKATGKTWGEWVELLNSLGAKDKPHKEIVKLLKDKAGLESAWWRQMITNGYEKIIGRRKTGETMDAGFQVGVSKTFDAPAEVVWDKLFSREGMEIWLGEAGDFELAEGNNFITENGITGEFRVVTPGSHIRLSWKPSRLKEFTTLQVRVTPKEKKSTVTFHHEKLKNEREREKMRELWRERLTRISEIIP